MTTQFNRIALEGAINTLREAYGANETTANDEMLKDVVGWATWNFGSRAEAMVRLKQALHTLERMVEIVKYKEDVAPPNSDPGRKKRVPHIYEDTLV